MADRATGAGKRADAGAASHGSEASDPSRFLTYLEKHRPLVESWIAGNAWQPVPGAHAGDDMASYLYRPLAHFNEGGGKRVRPVLALLGCEAVGGNPQLAVAPGCAVELFQSAALIHDDIADQGTLRRGEPCLHLTYGTGLAVNAGDAALVQATSAVLEEQSLPGEVRLRLLRQLTEMERRTLEGQALDLGWVRDDRWDITVADYLTMATHKTAFYSAATPLALGAICGGGTHDQLEALGGFGLKTGLAFQIADDLLNLEGDEHTQGKDLRSDITEGKRTLVAVHALGTLEGPRRSRLLEILSSGTSDPQCLDTAVRLMDESGSLDFARTYARSTVEAAIADLWDVELDGDARETLASMAHFFIERVG